MSVIFMLLTSTEFENKIGTMKSSPPNEIQLYHGAWVILQGKKAPVRAMAEERAPFIFSIDGELYTETGKPLPSLLPVPEIDMIIEAQPRQRNGPQGIGL